MTFTNDRYRAPKFLKVDKKEHILPLIIHGQGIFVFKSLDAASLNFFSIVDKDDKTGLAIVFRDDGISVRRLPAYEPLIDTTNVRGLSNLDGAYYWFSIDSQNQIIAAGVGEARLETCVYNYHFDFTEANKLFLESLVRITIPQDAHVIEPLRLIRDPITHSVPLLVKDTQHLKMKHIAKSKFLPRSFLSATSQKLYDCIAGKKFVLNDSDFPDFSKAIEYSIATPGCWCNTTLKAKAGEFGGGEKETYLRITLGQNNGESPGVPFVMEIWPAGHFSPIHNHGGANAVIRVLHGKVRANLYPFLSNEAVPFGHVDLKKDDITWISATLNQVHKLENRGSKTCITIQTYMYDYTDMMHYDYFDYLDGEGKLQQFEPDSDADYTRFKELIKKEWAMRPRCMPFCYFA
jgi:Cysteine dioxygenase type I